MWTFGLARLGVRREDRADDVELAEHRGDEYIQACAVGQEELRDVATSHVPGRAERGLPVAAAPVPGGVDEGRRGV